MKDADIKISGSPRSSEVMPIPSAIQSQHSHLWEELFQARKQLDAMREAVIIADANTRYWQERATHWMRRALDAEAGR